MSIKYEIRIRGRYSSFIFVAAIKYLCVEKSSLMKKERVHIVYFRPQSIIVGRARQPELEAADHVTLVIKRREK